MKFLLHCLFFLSVSVVATAQCPVIQAAMVNACGVSEGNNEFVLFTTTSSAYAGNYTFYYGNNTTPSLGLPVSILSGANAIAPTGIGTITSTNGCSITQVTSPVSVIPAGSQVLLIPSGFDANYDVSSICAANNLYVVYVDIASLPSSWAPADVLPNAPLVPAYLEVRNSATPCPGTVVNYSNGWTSNTDGNTVWWDAGGVATYGNNGCGIIAPPVTVSNISVPSVCAGTTSLSAGFTTTGSPNQYSLTWSAAAKAAGFTDVTNAPLSSSPLSITLPPGAPAATYTVTVTVKNAVTGISSIAQNVSLTTTVATNTPLFAPIAAICDLSSAPLLPAVSTNGIPGSWSPAVISNTASAAYVFTPVSGYCATAASLPVTVLPLPAVAVSGTTTICYGTGTNIGFTGTPNATVTYNINGGTNQTLVLDASGNALVATGNLFANATYNLVSAATATCSAPQSGSAAITVLPFFTASVSASAASVCAGTSANVLFTGTPNATITYTINGGGNLTVALDATGAATVPTGNLAANATYSLVSIFLAGPPACSKAVAGSVTINVNALPVSVIKGTSTICTGSSTNIQFTGTPNAVVTFNINGGINQTIHEDAGGNATVSTAVLFAPVTYNLISATNTGVNTCSQPVTGSAVISLNPVPAATISGTATICSGTGSMINFNGTPNATVAYTVNGGSSQTIVLDASGAAQVATGNITSTSTYQLVSISSATVPVCTVPLNGTVVITVKPFPAAVIAGTTSICNGSSTTVNFNGTPNTDVLYTSDGISNQTISLGASGSAAVNTGALVASQTYNLVSTSYSTAPACSQNLAGQAIVTVFPVTPVPLVVTPVTYCQNQAATALTASGVNLLWYTTASSTGVASAPFPNTAISSNTDYFVTQTINGCIGQPATLSVIVNPIPTVPAIPLGSLYRCGPGATTLKASAPGMVQWYSDSSLLNYLFTGVAYNTVVSATTNFYVTNTENNCVSPPVSVSVLVLPLVVQTTGFSYSPATVCQGSPKPVPVPVAGFSPGGVYSSAAGLSVHAITGVVDPSASVPGTYIVKYSLGPALCTPASASTATITITKNPTPPTAFSYASPVCSSASNPAPVPGAGFTAGGVYTGPAGVSVNPATGVINLSSSVAGTYTITYTLAATACTNASVSTANISITTPPSPTVSNGVRRCGNGSVTLSASSTGVISWYADTALTKLLATGTSYTTSIAATTNFYITNTTGGCISPKATAIATVVPVTAQVTSFSYTATAVCSGSTKPLPVPAPGFAAGGIYSSSTGLAIDSITGIIDPLTSLPGNYTVKYTLPASACASVSASTTTITVSKTLPTITTFSYASPVCPSSPNPLPVTGAGFTTGGVFSCSSGLAINAATGAIDIASSVPATYTVTYAVAQTTCGAAGSSTAVITITSSSAAPQTTNVQRCGSGIVTLNATATGTVKWYADSTLSTLLFTGPSYSPTVAATTSFYVTNTISTCVSSVTPVKAIVNPMTSQVTAFSYSPATVCAASAVPKPLLAVGFAAGGVFSSANGLSINDTTGVINIAASTPGNYTVTYTLPSSVCAFNNSSSASIVITNNAAPVTAFSYTTPVCSNAISVQPVVTAGFTGGGTFSAGSGVALNPATGIIDVAKSTAGNYKVTYSIPATLCTPGSTSQAEITIKAAPAPPVTTGGERCGSGVLNLSTTAGGTVNWYSTSGSGDPLATGTSYSPVVTATTTFYVTSFDGNCSSNGSPVTATVFPMPVQPSLGKYSSICTGDHLVLNPGNYYHYLWQDNSTSPSYTVTTAGNYSVKVTTVDGCSDSAAITIVISHNCDDILFPTAFSPNGDGLNDNFGPLPIRNLALLKNYSLRIFNRYGQVVFSSTNPYEKWDGSHRGQAADAGSYMWVAQYIYDSGEMLKKEGSVTIVQ